MVLAIYLALLLFLPLLFFNKSSRSLPPGSLGFPLIGETFQILKAMRENRFEEWLHERARKYGPISKLNFLGTPTVFLNGQALNKFVYTANESILSTHQPASIRRLLGERSILELSGEDHKRLRGAILSFLNPEALRQYVGKMDEEIRMHLTEYWHHNREIMVMPLMKTLTFNVICTLLFGVERGGRREKLIHLFKHVIKGSLEMPINLPFTRFNRSLDASSKAKQIIMELIHEKREKVERGDIPQNPDLITSLISMRDEANERLLSDEEIVHNCMGLMIAGHDTTSVLITFMIKILAEYPHVYQLVLNEQEEIARGKACGEVLTWDDLNKMKYSWKVATEILRMYPPVIMSFRRVAKDIEIEGYTIPRGWQVFWAGWMTHMDESIFKDPYKFDPLRHETQQAIPSFTFVAFGGGRRMCPGNEFARTETLTMIHYLVTRFKWKLSSKQNNFHHDPMPVFKHGLPIQVEIKKPHRDAV